MERNLANAWGWIKKGIKEKKKKPNHKIYSSEMVENRHYKKEDEEKEGEKES